MKRYAVVGILMIAVVVLVTVVFASIRKGQAMDVRFSKRDLPEHGVNIITSADPSFDEIVVNHFKNRSPETLKPLAVFIKNSGTRLVLAYALTWELRDKDGKIISSNTKGYSEPGVLMGNEIPSDLKHTTAIEPGTVRCFSRDSQIQQEATNTVHTSSVFQDIVASELSRATDITVSLDGVIFEDGLFMGPNKTGFFEQMQAMVTAKTDLLKEISVANQQGTVDEAFALIATSSREPDVVFGSKFSAQEWYRYFKKIYAAEITNQHRAYGKEKLVPHLVKAHGRVRKNLKKE